LESFSGGQGRKTYSRKREEFVADFSLVSRRCLTDFEYRIFRYHFLLGAGTDLCCRQLGMPRGTFFHQVYRIQEKLGRKFAELRPYALFPLDEYFGGTVRCEPAPALEPVPEPRVRARLRLPLSA
jgi:hypothetical protein